MKNILIVGGAGYIGSHTVKQLSNSGYNCIVIDNLIYGHKEAVLTPYFELADLLDKDSLDRVFKKYQIDSVIHFAAFAYVGESVQHPRKYYENNVVGTLNLLDVMLKNNVERIVFSSTCATYGEPQYIPIDESHPQEPINPYGRSKLMVEEVLKDYHQAYGLKYISLRYFNAAGCSKDKDIGESHSPETHLIPLVLQAIINQDKPIKVFGTNYDTPDGTCIRDYIHVEDLAVAHQLALEKLNQYSGCINLGTGIGTSVKEIIATAELVSGQHCPVTFTERRKGDPAKLYATNNKALEILGWVPKYTRIEDIIQTAWDWIKNKRY
ncbi:UDP-glucose 4-epimerase GalE [Gilliamella sp. Choc5-1]|uniref:UDP-glucose 4-epimerase GalE n=1 Tax=Gilliamella sp. Choc5-1 TaxID=3120238 RepID=UPI00080E953D|nr:UDP-glucose 4-epimerase GalE [Gilliamella apicola]OCG44235.1 UDP-glucose 4-epimerase GalE [Gilliamella apicola]